MSFVFVATFQYQTGGSTTLVITADNSVQAETIAEQYATEQWLRLIAVGTLRNFQASKLAAEKAADRAVSVPNSPVLSHNTFEHLCETTEKYRIPQLPIHHDPGTITLRKSELQVWKRKLLRKLSVTRLQELEEQTGKLLTVPGICWLLTESMCQSTPTLHRTTVAVRKHFTQSLATWPQYSGHTSYPIQLELTDTEQRQLRGYLRAAESKTRSLNSDYKAELQFFESSFCRWYGPFRKARISLLNHWINSMPETITLQLED